MEETFIGRSSSRSGDGGVPAVALTSVRAASLRRRGVLGMAVARIDARQSWMAATTLSGVSEISIF